MRVERTSSKAFSWKLPCPAKLLTFLLSCFAVHRFFPSSLLGRCSKDLCCLSQDRIVSIRDHILPIPRPWERPQYVSLENWVEELESRMEGVPEEMGFSEFEGKRQHLEGMGALQELLKISGLIIPKPWPVSLLPFIGEKVYLLWNTLCKSQPVDLNALHTKELLAKIQWIIRNVSFPLSPKLQDFLKKVKRLVIVRSDGDEDRKIPNAGGNESKVVPRSDVKQAIRDVVSSYFKERSLRIRLNAGDDLCRKPPSLNAFVQELIEETSDEIPVSFVHNTKDPSFTHFTHGNGAWMDRGDVGTDNAYCLPSKLQAELYCYKQPQEKRERWILQSDGTPAKVSNPKSLREKLSLSEKLLEKIWRLSELFRIFFRYKKANFEGLVFKNKVYFFQGRPIDSEQLLSPSYIAREDPTALSIEVLTVANHSVVVVNNEEELLRASSLREAQALFNSTVHKVVAVTRFPDDHSLLNFLHTLSIQTDKNFSLPCAIDPQTKRLFPSWNSTYEIRPGLISHPAKIVPPSSPFFDVNPEASREVRELVRQSPLDLLKLEKYFQIFRDRIKKFANPPKVLKEFEEKIARALEEIRAGGDPRFFAKIFEQMFRIDIEDFFHSIEMLQKSKLSHLGDLLLSARHVSIQEAFDYWEKFLLQFESQVDTHAPLREYVSFLKKSEAISLWLIFFQPTSLESCQIVPADQQFVEHLLELFFTSPELFANPKTFPAAWEELQVVAKEFSSDVFFSSIKELSPISRLIALRQMGKVVAYFDAAIKEVQRSHLPDRVARCREMLIVFFGILERWALELMPLKTFASLEETVAQVKRTLELSDTEPAQLLVSDFDVSEAMFGAALYYYPDNLGKIFTWVHQNCLKFLDFFSQRELSLEQIQKSFLPREMKIAISRIEQTNWGRQVQRTSFQITKEKVVFGYDLPLLVHSSQLKLIYKNESGEGSFLARFFNLQKNREIRMSAWVQSLQHAGIFEWESFSSLDDILEFSCSMTQNVQSFLREYMMMAEYTMGQTFSEILVNLFERWKDHQSKLASYFLRKAQINIWNSDLDKKEMALDIWKAFIEMGHSCKEALNVAKTAARSENPDIIYHVALPLWKMLIKVGREYESAIRVVEDLSRRDDRKQEDLIIIFTLLKTLVEQGHGYEIAIKKAEMGLKNMHLGEGAFALWKALLKKGQGYKAGIKIAEELMENTSPAMKNVALHLLIELVKRGYGYKNAEKAARDNIHLSYLRQSSNELLKALATKDQK